MKLDTIVTKILGLFGRKPAAAKAGVAQAGKKNPAQAADRASAKRGRESAKLARKAARVTRKLAR